MHLVSIALCGPSVRALTRRFDKLRATLSQGARVRHKPLSPWEKGWGEGQTAG